ncbi:hypothetical protein BC830DRAFT_838738 [Chytriomyces sp. MP71]|nr:hypothetical protein BC830DRAFT_838738 [Chytriomyces sp. MP71]
MGRTPHNMSGVPVHVTEEIVDYRRSVNQFVGSSDLVLELGSAQGLTCALLAAAAAKAVGIDKSPEQHRISVERFPRATHANLTFIHADAFDVRAALALGVPFTKLYIDVSGNRVVGDVIELIGAYEKAFPSLELIVVKCFPFKRLLLNCSVWPAAEGEGEMGASRTKNGDKQVEKWSYSDPHGTSVALVLCLLGVGFAWLRVSRAK